MGKRQLDRMAKAFEKSLPKRDYLSSEELYKTFAVSFNTNDFQCSTRDNQIVVSAKISKEEFDGILYQHAVYIMEYLKEKGFTKLAL